MHASHSRRVYLNIIVWVPVRVVYNNRVSSSQVDAKTTSPCGEEKDKVRRVGCVESINGLLSLWSGHVAIDTLKLVAEVLEEVFKNIQHTSHLCCVKKEVVHFKCEVFRKSISSTHKHIHTPILTHTHTHTPTHSYLRED